MLETCPVVDEPSDTQLPEPQQATKPTKRRGPLIVGIARRSPRGTWLSERVRHEGPLFASFRLPRCHHPRGRRCSGLEGLFHLPRTASSTPWWRSADAELAFNEGLTLLDETDLLGPPRDQLPWAPFGDVSVLPWHGNLAAARSSIVAHYEVWDGHLGESAATLSGLDPDPALLGVAVSDLGRCGRRGRRGYRVDLQRLGSLRFELAALDDPSRQEIDTLFTPSEAQCSRGAV